MNNILDNINIFKKYTYHEVIDPNISLDELIEKINNKKNWNIKDSKDMLDILYEIEKNEIDLFSPVSQEIAIKMAEKAREKFNSDYSISVTGNAGPTSDGSKSKVGDCYIAISSEDQLFCEKYEVISSREDFIKTVTENSFKLFVDKIINQ